MYSLILRYLKSSPYFADRLASCEPTRPEWNNEYLANGMFNINTLRLRQNCRHFSDDIIKCIFFNGNVLISIKISLKFVPKGQINNIPALV